MYAIFYFIRIYEILLLQIFHVIGIVLESDGNKWCLGASKTSNRPVGIVVAAPDGNRKAKGQRAVLIMQSDPESNSARFSFYHSKWLCRVSAVRNIFNVGDRVQLNAQCEYLDGVSLSGKCLGSPKECRYGVVSAVGPIRNGIQRNVEVVALLNDADTAHGIGRNHGYLYSLYPSAALVFAEKASTLFSTTMEELSSHIKSNLQLYPHLQKLDVSMLVAKMGFQVILLFRIIFYN